MKIRLKEPIANSNEVPKDQLRFSSNLNTLLVGDTTGGKALLTKATGYGLRQNQDWVRPETHPDDNPCDGTYRQAVHSLIAGESVCHLLEATQNAFAYRSQVLKKQFSRNDTIAWKTVGADFVEVRWFQQYVLFKAHVSAPIG